MNKTHEMLKHLRKYWNGLIGKEEEKGDDYDFVKDNFTLYELGGGWGNKISFLDYEPGIAEQRVYGFKNGMFGPGRPQKGDLLKVEFKNTNTGEPTDTAWVFVSVRLESNPPDMFFADVKYLGGEDKLNELLEERDELRES